MTTDKPNTHSPGKGGIYNFAEHNKNVVLLMKDEIIIEMAAEVIDIQKAAKADDGEHMFADRNTFMLSALQTYESRGGHVDCWGCIAAPMMAINEINGIKPKGRYIR